MAAEQPRPEVRARAIVVEIESGVYNPAFDLHQALLGGFCPIPFPLLESPIADSFCETLF